MSRYTAFTDNNVFADKSINLVGNIFYESIIQQFSGKTISDVLAITGKTSKVILDVDTGAVSNLALITDDTEVFDYLSKNVKALFQPESFIKLKTTLQFKKYGFFFELHFISTNLVTITQDGLYIQQTADIPSNIL